MPTHTADDLGRYPLGMEIPLFLQCTTGDLEPRTDTPLTHPTVEVRKDGSAVHTYFGRVPADDQRDQTGVFRGRLMLGAGFETGRYTLTYRWQTSDAYHRVALQSVQIVGGGSADGAIIAMHAAERAEARYLIMQTDAGLLKKGVNPR